MLKNLNVRYKILLISVSLFINVIIMAAVSVNSLGNARTAMDTMYNKNLTAVNISGDLRTQARAINARLLEMHVTTEDGNKDETIKEIENRLVIMTENINKLDSVATDEKQKEILVEVRKENKNMQDFTNHIIDLTKQELVFDVLIYYNDNKKIMEDYQTDVVELNKYNMELAENTNNDSQAAYKKAVRNAGLICLAMVIFGAVMSFVITRNIKVGLRKCVDFIQVLATGDFTEEQDLKEAKRKDEIGLLTAAVYSMQTSIKELVVNAKTEVESIDQDVELVQAQCDKLDEEVQAVSATTEQLAAAMQETAALGSEMLTMSERMKVATNEITMKAQNGSERANEIKDRALDANQMIRNGQEAAKKLYEESRVLLEQSIKEAKVVEEINVLSDGIMEITSQTNLLALNASIEAARAGEAGRGFAVVANEISFLADESQATVSKIQDVTKRVMDAVEKLVTSSNTLLEYVTEDVNENNERVLSVIDAYKKDADFVSSLVTEVNEAALEMNSTIDRMGVSIDSVSNAAVESAEGTTVAATSLSEITMSAKEVLETVDRTKQSKDKLDEEIGKFVV